MNSGKHDESSVSKNPVILHVGVYNASGISKDEKEWTKADKETVTAQMFSTFKGKSFVSDGKSYEFKSQIIDFSDIINSQLDYLDLLAAPGGNAYWKDQWTNLSKAATFRKNIIDFVSNGGGYIGTCGGACIVTLGKKEPPGRRRGEYRAKSIPEWRQLDCYLKMVKIWSNGFWFEEQQYNARPPYDADSHLGGIPLNSYVFDTDDAETILGIRDKTVNIRYWGGSAYWGGEDDIVPLAKFEQEPKHLYPLHWRNGKKVHTDLMADDGFSIISATYGKGRLVLFSQHPEVPSFHHGTKADVVENRQKTKYRFNQKLDSNTDENNKQLLFSAGIWCTRHSNGTIPHKPDEPDKPQPSSSGDDSKANKPIFEVIVSFLKKLFGK